MRSGFDQPADRSGKLCGRAGPTISAKMIKRRVFPAGFVEPCIPILAHKPPAGPQWVHEIKHDGYRLIVRRDGERVRLFTRRGYDWTEQFSTIAAAAAPLRAKSFTIAQGHCDVVMSGARMCAIPASRR